MKFTITRQNLHQGLAAVSASIPTKTTLPVLSNILLEARDGVVWMSGTDLDVAVRVKVPGRRVQTRNRAVKARPPRDEVDQHLSSPVLQSEKASVRAEV